MATTLQVGPVLRVLADNVDEGIHVVDRQGTTVLYNAQAGQNDGLDPSEVIGKHLLEVFPSLDHGSSTLLKVLETGESLENQQQSFTSFKGNRVTTINSTWPIYDGGQLIGAMEVSKDVTRVRELSEQVVDLRAELLMKRRRRAVVRSDARYSFDDLIGQDPRFMEVKEHASRAAGRSAAVLVYGETGTGKELFVHAIHRASPRSARPLVAQNCAALPEGLLEGILFGTVRGSFTGAEDRPGLLELASGGTLYLDEINSMNLDLQAKLLRVLQDGRFRRVGESQERSADLRIIASTNEDPQEAIRNRRLRQDLYYRLNVIFLEIPPLRERPGDILLLANRFFQERQRRINPAVKGLDLQVERFFRSYPWPGNVRELEHAIEAGLLMSRGERIAMADLPAHLRRAAGDQPPAEGRPEEAPVEPHRLKERLEATERQTVRAALEQSAWNLSRAAKLLEIPRQTLQYRVKVLKLSRPGKGERRA